MITSGNISAEQLRKELERKICDLLIGYHAATGVQPVDVELVYRKLNQGKQGVKKMALKVTVEV